MPATLFADQVTVGGMGLDGRGDKIADFALRATATGNLSLVEIKMPKTPLLQPRPYRRGVHGPGHELAGAVTQILDQRRLLQQEFLIRRARSRAPDIEDHALGALVIAGRTPDDPDRTKSLDLYRSELRTVTVLTFDEVIDKLEIVLGILKAGGTAPEEAEP